MRNPYKPICIFSLMFVLLACFYVGFIFFLGRENIDIVKEKEGKNRQSSSNTLEGKLPELENKPLRMLFFGDIMLDRHVGERVEKNGLDYIFKKISGEKNNFFQGYNLISGNLEGAVTNDGVHYNPVIAYDFAFAPELISGLKNYNINFFNLANNHFADQGERGIIETRRNLEELDFGYVGCSDGRMGECSSKIIKFTDRDIGMVGFSIVYTKFDFIIAKKIMEELVSSTDLIIVNIHWGNEYEREFNVAQQKVAHFLIDLGADIIIGHHPHVIQGMEIYKDKPIFYSLGNFIFDQYFSPDTQEGLAVGVNVSNQDIDFFLFPFKSRLSQVELLSEKERNEFLQRLLQGSKINAVIANRITGGQFSIKIND